MKVRSALIGFVLSLVLILPNARAGEKVIFLRVRKDGLNLRTDSTIGSQSIAKLKRGQVLVAVGKLYEWYRVKLPEWVKVYVYRKYAQTRDGKVEIIANRVNIRSGPDLSYAVLGQANSGDRFSLCRRQLGGDWLCVLSGDHPLYGWVHEKGVEVLPGEVKVGKTEVKKEVVEVKEKPVAKEPIEKKEETTGKSAVKEDLPIAKGIVREMGRVLGVKYKYKLVDEKGKVLYYLSGEREMISPFVDKEVFVFGEVNSVVRDVPVLSVRKIALTKVGLDQQ